MKLFRGRQFYYCFHSTSFRHCFRSRFTYLHFFDSILFLLLHFRLLSWDIGYNPNTIQGDIHPRVFKSHLRMASIYAGCNYVVTVRDPAKTAISFYNFFIAKQVPFVVNDPNMDVSTFLLQTPFVTGSKDPLRASIWDYYVEYHTLLKHKCPSVLILVYEDLLSDPSKSSSIRTLARFIGIEDNDDERFEELIRKVTRLSTKEYMGQYMTKFDEPYERAKKLNRAGDLSQLHPGAKIALATHKQSFDTEAKAFLDDMWKQNMELLGYENYAAFAHAIRERNRNLFGNIK